MESSSSENVLLKLFHPTCPKMGSPWATPKTKNNFFFQKSQNQILSFQNLIILTKYRMFWLSYECFSIWCNAFLLKSVISSHNSCVANVWRSRSIAADVNDEAESLEVAKWNQSQLSDGFSICWMSCRRSAQAITRKSSGRPTPYKLWCIHPWTNKHRSC